MLDISWLCHRRRRWFKNWVFQNCLKTSWPFYIYAKLYIDISKAQHKLKAGKAESWLQRWAQRSRLLPKGRGSKAGLETSRAAALTFRESLSLFFLPLNSLLQLSFVGFMKGEEVMIGKRKLRFFKVGYLGWHFSQCQRVKFQEGSCNAGRLHTWNVSPILRLALQSTDVYVLPWCARQTQVPEQCPFSQSLWSSSGQNLNSWKLVLSPALPGIWPKAGIILPKQDNHSFCLHGFPIDAPCPLAPLVHTSPRFQLKTNGAAPCLILTQLTFSLLMLWFHHEFQALLCLEINSNRLYPSSQNCFNAEKCSKSTAEYCLPQHDDAPLLSFNLMPLCSAWGWLGGSAWLWSNEFC